MLRRDALYVWRLRVEAFADVSEVERAAWRGLLSPAELLRADGFRGEGFRRDYTLAHVALRTVLGECLGVAAGAVRFSEAAKGVAGGSSGKPILAPGMGMPDLIFNLSHTAGAVLIGVSLGRELGVDIERQRPLDDLEGMAETVMSPVELERWRALEAGERILGFYNLWTRKESYLKAMGQGLYHGLQQVTVPVSAKAMDPLGGEWGRVLDPALGGEWRVTDVPVPQGYSASICWEGSGMPVVVVTDLVPESLFQGRA